MLSVLSLCNYLRWTLIKSAQWPKRERGRAGSMACGWKHPLFLDFLFLFYQENGVALLSTYKKQTTCEKKKATAAAVKRIGNEV